MTFSKARIPISPLATVLALAATMFSACKDNGVQTPAATVPGARASADILTAAPDECPVAAQLPPVQDCARETICKSSDACSTAIAALSDLVRTCLAELQLGCASVELSLDSEGCPAGRNILARIGESKALTACLEPKIKAVSWPCAKGRKITAGIPCSK